MGVSAPESAGFSETAKGEFQSFFLYLYPSVRSCGCESILHRERRRVAAGNWPESQGPWRWGFPPTAAPSGTPLRRQHRFGFPRAFTEPYPSVIRRGMIARPRVLEGFALTFSSCYFVFFSVSRPAFSALWPQFRVFIPKTTNLLFFYGV